MISRKSAINFVSGLLEQVRSRGVSTDGWIIDHVCFRAGSLSEYESLKASLTSGSQEPLGGFLLSAAIVNGRPIASIRFNEPLLVDNYLIEAIEIPAPKAGTEYASGFEHIEVVTTKSFGELLQVFADFPVEDATHKLLNPELIVTLPAGRIKFHHLPLSCLIEVENETELHNWLLQTSILSKLAPWQPMISGSIPIGVHLEKSDLDILLFSESPGLAKIVITDVLKEIGSISWIESEGSAGEFWGRLTTGPRIVELFISDQPVLDQRSHRHLLTEYLYLVKHGQALRDQVKAMKMSGASTEEAFARALGVSGDPYQKLIYIP